MRIKNKKMYYLRPKKVITDSEGGKYAVYEEAIEIKANIYPANGKLQAEIYGVRLNYILNMLYDGCLYKIIADGALHYISDDGKIDFCEGYGICVNVPPNSEPDYKIISIKCSGHLIMELERI